MNVVPWPASKEYALIKNCGCWKVNLAQGVMVLPCAGHQPAVLSAIEADGGGR